MSYEGEESTGADPLLLAPPLWRSRDEPMVRQIVALLGEEGTFETASLIATIKRHVEQVAGLGRLLDLYPSLFKTQTLGGQKRRNVDTLVDRLSAATPFTLELMLPMRAISGKTFLLARLNFMRLLTYVVSTHLGQRRDLAPKLLEQIHEEISRCILARVCEELMASVVCRQDIPKETRRRAALGLTHLWEDRIHFPMREFFPVLEATWEARRRIPVTYGTLAGTAEIFELMSQGCDPEFVEYFSLDDAPEDELMAFREFLFGLSTEELQLLESHKNEAGLAVVSSETVARELAPESLAVINPDDVASHLYTFFMKRHLEATARNIGHLPGPKHTAEEYVMIAFLSRHDPVIFGEE